jgi:hypothetical protein
MLSVVPTAATGEWKLAQADSLRMDIMAVQSGNVFYGLTKYISEAELPVEYLKMNPACFFFRICLTLQDGSICICAQIKTAKDRRSMSGRRALIAYCSS